MEMKQLHNHDVCELHKAQNLTPETMTKHSGISYVSETETKWHT